MVQIVMIYGYARAGKDTLADGLRIGSKNGMVRLSFASSLKAVVAKAVSHYVKVDYANDAEKMQDRDLLVEFGRAVRRRNPLAFAETLCEQMYFHDQMPEYFGRGGSYVITDARYFNEYQYVTQWAKEHGHPVVSVYVWREGNSYANIEERDSIAEVLEHVKFDYLIDGEAYDADNVRQKGIDLAKTLNL